jgi:hypothetical protein
MGDWTGPASQLSGAIEEFCKSTRPHDKIVEKRMLPDLRKFMSTKTSSVSILIPGLQQARLALFFDTPTGLKYLAHFRKSRYNSFAGTAQMFYKLVTYAK